MSSLRNPGVRRIGMVRTSKKSPWTRGAEDISMKAPEATGRMITICTLWGRMVSRAEMISSTGNKKGRLPSGFSLIEVLLAVVVLSLAILMIYRSNLSSMNVYSEYKNRLNIQSWAEEKIWEAKEKILQSDVPEEGQSAGEISHRNKTYQWRLEVKRDGSEDTYTIRLDIQWTEGRRTAALSRVSYVQKAGAKA